MKTINILERRCRRALSSGWKALDTKPGRSVENRARIESSRSYAVCDDGTVIFDEMARVTDVSERLSLTARSLSGQWIIFKIRTKYNFDTSARGRSGMR